MEHLLKTSALLSVMHLTCMLLDEELSWLSQSLQCRLDSSINVWLMKCTVLTFSAGHVQTADSSLLSASAFSLPSLCIERAKWMASQVIHHISPFYQGGFSARLHCSPLLPSNDKRIRNSVVYQRETVFSSLRIQSNTEVLCWRILLPTISATLLTSRTFCRKWNGFLN